MVASGFREGFILDWKNCEVDYLFTFHPQRHIGDELWKCSVSADPAQLDAVFAQLASRIEAIGAYQVVRSTDTIIDITPQGCSKAAAVEAVLDMLGRSFDDAAAIGDGRHRCAADPPKRPWRDPGKRQRRMPPGCTADRARL